MRENPGRKLAAWCVAMLLILAARPVFSAGSAAESALVVSGRGGAMPAQRFRPFSSIGMGAVSGLAGLGFDVATPLSRKLNLRVGAGFFSYSTSFQEQGAKINAALSLRSGYAALDWFPFGGRLHLSPLVVFANGNNVRATALMPGGSAITLNGWDYTSSYADPLHGAGSVKFRHAAPGFSAGLGNLVPRTRNHLSFPIEAGFYYVGQPLLKVSFSGSACDPIQPQAIGCAPVAQDPTFKENLAAFIVRNNHNLSYASFFPILSSGVGYRF
jgi:hypothetical protein